MPTPQEQQWAFALKRSRRQVMKQQKHVPLDLQKKQVMEDMQYFKSKLIEAAKNKDENEVKKYFEKLIDLRTKQLKILFEQINDFYGTVQEENIKFQLKKFYRDCTKLATATEILLDSKSSL